MGQPRKSCPDCGGTKDPGQGHKWCDSCRAQRREVRQYRRRGIRGFMLLPRYGITIAEYDAMLASQNGVCAICKRVPPSSRILKFSVDHDHETGEVRGLLCQRCNMALHYLEDRPWHEAAEQYLSSPPSGRCGSLLAEPVSSLSGLPETLAALKATKAIAVGAIEILRTDRADLVILVAYMAAEGFTPNQIAYAVENPWKYTDVLAAAKAALAKGSW